MESAVVISSNAILREGLCRIISNDDFVVIDSAAHPNSIDWQEHPDNILTIIDSNAGAEQISSIDLVMQEKESARCVVLAENLHLEDMLSCFERRAQGYLVKDISCAPLIISLKLVSLGERVYPSAMIDLLSEKRSNLLENNNPGPEAEAANLTQREMDVLTFLMIGHSNKLIARELSLSEATIKVHVKAILRKLDVGNRTQAAMWGTSHHISKNAELQVSY